MRQRTKKKKRIPKGRPRPSNRPIGLSRRPRSPAATAGASGAFGEPSSDAAEDPGLVNGLGLSGPNGECIRRSHLRYLRAKVDLTEGGTPPTYINLAKRLGISPQALWKFRRRYPWLDGWCNTFVLADNAVLVGLVQRRLAMLAIQGSPEHTELFFKSVAGAFDLRGEGGAGGGSSPGTMTVVQNYLVPRPDYPKLEAAPERGRSPTLAVIPTVVVR